jgi:O-antigen/teichoic acid export membrane protein
MFLRRFSWTLAANVIYGVSQVFVLLILANLGGETILGTYGVANAIVAPAIMGANLGLVGLAASDISRQYSHRVYLALRFKALLLAVLGVNIWTSYGTSAALAPVILLVSIGKFVESLNELCFAFMHRDGLVHRVAFSQALKALFLPLALAVGFLSTKSLSGALLGAIVARILLLAADSSILSFEKSNSEKFNERSLFALALPLGLTSFLTTLNLSIPRYVIGDFYGPQAVGVFEMVYLFAAVSTVIFNSLGMALLYGLAEKSKNADLSGSVRLISLSILLVLGIAFLSIVVASLMGGWLLEILYGAGARAHSVYLVPVLLVGTLSNICTVLGYSLTSLRSIKHQAPALALICLVQAFCCATFVPDMGLKGAYLSAGIANVIQILIFTVMLARVFKGVGLERAS